MKAPSAKTRLHDHSLRASIPDQEVSCEREDWTAECNKLHTLADGRRNDKSPHERYRNGSQKSAPAPVVRHGR